MKQKEIDEIIGMDNDDLLDKFESAANRVLCVALQHGSEHKEQYLRIARDDRDFIQQEILKRMTKEAPEAATSEAPGTEQK